jgi:hypothetical protein
MQLQPPTAALDRGAARPISVAELFTIGIGPSSSHTVGPMRAAYDFAQRALAQDLPPVGVTCDLYGSLALTGRGHATDTAVILGLAGWEPERLDPDAAPGILAGIRDTGRLTLAGARALPFSEAADVVFHPRDFLAEHPNGLTFTARLADGTGYAETYFSIGGGAILRKGAPLPSHNVAVRHPFSSSAELLARGDETGLSIADMVRANEEAWRSPEEADAFLDEVRAAMRVCIDRGIAQEGELPGGLRVRRRARAIERALTGCVPGSNPAEVFEWVSLWALAAHFGGGTRRQQPAGRECRGNRHGAQPRPHLRPDRRSGADPLHRAQHDGRGEGDQRRLSGAARRREPRRQSRRGHRDDAPDRRGHAHQVQGDEPRRPRGQRGGVLTHRATLTAIEAAKPILAPVRLPNPR